MRKRATAVVVRHGRVLLVRDRGRHHYSLPGGGIRRGEATTHAAARELREELGLKAVGVTRLRGSDFKGTVSKHKACLVRAKGKPRLNRRELSKFIWWDMKKPIPVYGHVRAALKKMIRRKH